MTNPPSEKGGDTTPLGLLRYALEYFAAAHATDRAIGDDEGHEIHAPMVVNFLLGQSVELALKGYLLAKGVPVKSLKQQYGHDLLKLFDDAKAMGFGSSRVTNKDRPMLWLLNDYYKSRELQYFRSGTKERFPVAGPLKSSTISILLAVMDDVPGSELLRDRKAADLLFRLGMAE